MSLALIVGCIVGHRHNYSSVCFSGLCWGSRLVSSSCILWGLF